jgi:hypothetical protein
MMAVKSKQDRVERTRQWARKYQRTLRLWFTCWVFGTAVAIAGIYHGVMLGLAYWVITAVIGFVLGTIATAAIADWKHIDEHWRTKR